MNVLLHQKFQSYFLRKTEDVTIVQFAYLEESFAALIGIIFIYEAFDKMIDINKQRPLRLNTVDALPPNCFCSFVNGTTLSNSSATINVINTIVDVIEMTALIL